MPGSASRVWRLNDPLIFVTDESSNELFLSAPVDKAEDSSSASTSMMAQEHAPL